MIQTEMQFLKQKKLWKSEAMKLGEKLHEKYKDSDNVAIINHYNFEYYTIFIKVDPISFCSTCLEERCPVLLQREHPCSECGVFYKRNENAPIELTLINGRRKNAFFECRKYYNGEYIHSTNYSIDEIKINSFIKRFFLLKNFR